MTISDEAVEAAVDAYDGGTMRTALEAAAPFIRAECLEEAGDAAADPSPEDMDACFIDQADVGHWLRARAAAERGGE